MTVPGLNVGASASEAENTATSNVIYDATLKAADPKPQITINTNEVIIKHGNDTIIVPRTVHEASENAKKNPAVKKGLKKTFESLEADPHVTDFGITRSIADPRPLITIPRSDFPVVVTPKRTRRARPSRHSESLAQPRETQMVVRMERRSYLRTHR